MTEERIRFKAKMAGIPFEAVSRHPSVNTVFRKYMTEEDPAFLCEVTDEDLEKEQSILEKQKEKDPGIVYRDFAFSLENSAIHRKLINQLIEYDVIMLHGSALCMDGEAVIFSAPSGTGKSTHTGLWRKVFGERVQMIDDDKPFIRIEGEQAVVYGTPWNGKHRIGSNMSAPLKAVVELTRGTENKIIPMNKIQAFQLLLKQIYIPKDPETAGKVMKTADRILQTVPFRLLACNMEDEAVLTAWEGIFQER